MSPFGKLCSDTIPTVQLKVSECLPSSMSSDDVLICTIVQIGGGIDESAQGDTYLEDS